MLVLTPRGAGQRSQRFRRSIQPWSGNITHSNAAFGSLLVTNDYGVVGDRDEESDDNYRYRIHFDKLEQGELIDGE